MNVSRYTANGMIQRNGTEARFNRMWLVTANIRPDGTSAAANQNSRKRHVGAGPMSSWLNAISANRLFQTMIEAAKTNSDRAMYPASHHVLCVRTPIRGS